MIKATSNVGAVRGTLRKLEKKLIFTESETLNQTAKLAAKAQRAEAVRVFDRPTTYLQMALFNPRKKLGFTGIPSKFNTLRVEIIPGGPGGRFRATGHRVQEVLRLEVLGGTKNPTKRAIPVPVSGNARYNKFGGIPRSYIKNLLAKSDHVSLGPNQGLPPGIYKRLGRGKLKMIVAWEPRAQYAPVFRFHQVAEGVADREFQKVFRREFRREMKELLFR